MLSTIHSIWYIIITMYSKIDMVYHPQRPPDFLSCFQLPAGMRCTAPRHQWALGKLASMDALQFQLRGRRHHTHPRGHERGFSVEDYGGDHGMFDLWTQAFFMLYVMMMIWNATYLVQYVSIFEWSLLEAKMTRSFFFYLFMISMISKSWW